MKTSEFPSVVAAKRAASTQLAYYKAMMTAPAQKQPKAQASSPKKSTAKSHGK